MNMKSFCVVVAVGMTFALSAAVEFSAFENPAKAHRPETWFHLIGGNVAKPGLDADLDALRDAGISGIQLFHGQIGNRKWPGVEQQIKCLSADWDDMIRHAAEGCAKRGLSFKMQNCPGWSMSGGPWIAPSNAMRELVFSRIDVQGGGRVSVKLPDPPDVKMNDRSHDYREICVLAFPTPEGDTSEAFARSTPDEQSDKDGVLRLVYRFDKPLAFRSVTIPSPKSMNPPWSYHIDLSVRVNDGGEIVLPQSNWQDYPGITLALGETRSTNEWTISVRYKHAIARDFLKKGPVVFRTGARLHDWEGKSGYTLRSMRKDDPCGFNPSRFVRGEAVVDVTPHFKNGTLDWTPPSGGSWTVLRFGHRNMMMRNGPAPGEATGWECSKLDKSGIEANFAAYLGRLAKGPLAGGLLKGFVVDSWECRRQTWSGSLEDDFKSMRGYDPHLKLPALFGWIVDSPEKTENFLHDWRRTLGELVENNYYARMAALAREHGMTTQYETAFGDVIPGDILAYWKYCDMPMCEFWAPRSQNHCGQPDFKPIKPCASAAHVYGKRRVAAEACTNTGLNWREHLRGLKGVINNAFSRGVTHLVFHTYTHNPRADWKEPGSSFGFSIGTPFLRGQTWWRYMPEFTAWVARCETMLEAGRPANDILWYLGEAVDHKPSEANPFPRGYRYDYVNADALLNRISVKDGLFTTPEGVSWKVLWVPDVRWMSEKVKAKLARLAADGGRIEYGGPADVVRGIAPDVVVGPDAKGRAISDWRKDWNEEMVEWLHRRGDSSDWYFAAANNNDGYEGEVTFRATGAAEIWDPATGKRRAAEVTRRTGSTTTVRLSLASAESVFVVFGGKSRISGKPRISGGSGISGISGWTLSFPAGWGAPASMKLDKLVSWHELPISEEGRRFSGTAAYTTTFSAKAGERLTLDLGRVETAATVYVNGKKVRALWAEPYRCEIDGSLLKDGANELKIEVTSTWHNRLAYDAGLPEAERKTWTIAAPGKNSRLQPSGLFGPVRVIRHGEAVALSNAAPAPSAPVPVTYIMVCCHGADKGTKFLANGAWDSRHDYRNYPFALDMMRKIKEAGINVVGIDFTNAAQWDQQRDLHWPMLLNVVKAVKELDMQYFLFLGNTAYNTMKYWNSKAKIVWEEFAQDPHYRRYGFGDDRPMITIFLPGRHFAAHLAKTPPEEKNWIEKFRIGTCQVNDPIVFAPTDGWGYRNMSAGSTDLARFAAPNSGVDPKQWARVDANEWRRRVKWALGAKEYAVIGTYDDTCDCIFWGIADVSASRNPVHVHADTKNDPYIYYNIVKEELAKWRKQQPARK